VASPDVEIDRRGEILVAWTQNTVLGPAPPRGPNYVRVASRRTDGDWSAPRTVGRTRHFVDGNPRLAVDEDGDAVVGWHGVRRRGSSVRDELQVAYRPAGGAFGSARSLEVGAIDHAVAIGARGVAYATWAVTVPPAHVRSAIRLAHRTASGAWTRPVTVFADRAGGPQLGLPGDGSLLLAWRGGQQGIGATRTGVAMAAEGVAGAIGPAKVLSPARTLGPKLAVTRSGEAIVAWTAVGGALDPAAGAPGPLLGRATRRRGVRSRRGRSGPAVRRGGDARRRHCRDGVERHGAARRRASCGRRLRRRRADLVARGLPRPRRG
jgi:hypothetical protein